MDGGVWMSRKDVIRFETAQDFIDGKITRCEAASALGITERALTNLANKVRKKGLLGVAHGNKGRTPKNKKPKEMKAKAIRLKKEKYFDFNINHTLDKLIEEDPEFTLCYSTLYRWYIEAGLGKFKQHRRKKVSKKLRERYKQEGYFIQMDGSPHNWFGEQESCLISMIDDATSKILAAQFWPSETTIGCLSVLREFIAVHGIPSFIYTDRAGIYGGSKRQEFSHFEAACEELDIKIIYANSAEGKGRIERSYRTLQDRLVAAMRLAGIIEFDQANLFLKDFLKEEWEKKFTIDAINPMPAYKPIPIHKSPKQVCCIKEKREIKKNSTISFQNVIYLLIAKENEPKITSNAAEIRIYPDGTWSVFVEDRRVNVIIAPASHQPDPRFRDKVRPGNIDVQSHGIRMRKTG